VGETRDGGDGGEVSVGRCQRRLQIEGGWDKGGRGLSKWDVYTNRYQVTLPTTGKVETGNVAINAYDRGQYLKDIAMMRGIGIDAYRFSVSWPRVLPEGIGRVNRTGLDYYSRLVDDLLAAGITPMVTLYHWDFPWVLHEKGGFRNRDVIAWFSEYAGTIFSELGDRVPLFATMNEPFFDLFYMDLIAKHVIEKQPPLAFTAAEWAEQIPALHNLYLASAAACRAYRGLGLKGEIGIALPLSPTRPVNPDSRDDVEAARTWDLFFNRWPLDAAIKGIYADDVLATLRRLLPGFAVSDEDGDLLAGNTVDFVGVNFYSPAYCRRDDSLPLGVEWGINDDPVPAFNGPVRPDALYELLMRIKSDYDDLPIYVTENGAGFGPRDEVMEGGVVRDPLRADYIRRHTDAVLRARKDGADVRGYMEWCPFDNFEWFRGYDTRFGMVHVDFATQKRTPKESFHAYRDIIARQRAAG
jgi:beta-glucosidase